MNEVKMPNLFYFFHPTWKTCQALQVYHNCSDSLGLKTMTKILDPHGSFLERWNKFFLLSHVVAVYLDPIFFYVPVIDRNKSCIGLDKKLLIAVIVMRSFTDVIYVLHIIFQFRTGFVAASSRVFVKGHLVNDPVAIARRYLSSYFFVDFLAALPLPQVVILIVIPNLQGSASLDTKNLLLYAVLFQFFPRVFRIYPLYKEVTRTCGIITERAWIGAAFNFFLYILFSHMFGASWYVLSIQREDRCWRNACGTEAACDPSSLYCGNNNSVGSKSFLNASCPHTESDATPFDFGIYLTALKSGVVESTDFHQKLCFCMWWGLRNLSSLGQNLETSTFVGEIYFAASISILGLVFFALLIGNMQVPIFEKMDAQLQDALCDRMEPAFYAEGSYIIREGDPVDEMLFIGRGKLLTVTTDGGRAGFFNSEIIKAGDFCGEELFTWALDPHSTTNLPISTRTVRALSEVEGFTLVSDNLKYVASKFRRIHSKQLQHTFRFYSQQWRTWAACFIQAAWRRYHKKKLEESLREEENRLQDVLQLS
ncbi:hypothetical protein C5167_031776 [Papaver somniferum]|uniref:Cyclic nucleotide-binding domain-containing protein n=1 Tax=Papaver somniferum TaxID=3469 RepID=A0A4Y7K883_PAPSO|nr:hypothetical protein C5167_031776 [Papaver somniferum]